MSIRRLAPIVLVVTVSSVMLGSCRQPAEPEVEERPAIVVENMGLRLRLAGVPGSFMVVVNDGDQLILEPSDSSTEGQIHFANNPPKRARTSQPRSRPTRSSLKIRRTVTTSVVRSSPVSWARASTHADATSMMEPRSRKQWSSHSTPTKTES